MKRLFTLILYICLFQSCKTQTPLTGLFTQPHQWPLPDSVSRKIKLAIDKGYTEYFSVNSLKFRFQKSAVTTGKYDLQVLQNSRWVTNLTLAMPEYSFHLTPDFNLDGFFDLSYINRGNFEIYFFDNQKNKFATKPLIFPYDHALLDSSNVIYGTNTKMAHTWNIDIFSLKGGKVHSLLKSKIVFEDNYNTGSSKAMYALVYKCNNGIATDTVLVEKIMINKEWADFGLNKFMKDLVRGKEY